MPVTGLTAPTPDGYRLRARRVAGTLWAYPPPGATIKTRITLVWTDDEPLAERSVWLDVALGLFIAAVLVGFVLVVLP